VRAVVVDGVLGSGLPGRAGMADDDPLLLALLEALLDIAAAPARSSRG
jgi:hypothetical protein